MIPYHARRRAHDVHTICPWCGAEKSSACEFEAGFCPWEGPAEAADPAFPLRTPASRAMWPWEYKAQQDALKAEEIARS